MKSLYAIALFCLSASLLAEMSPSSSSSAGGVFQNFDQVRPTLEWEVLKGYRLFFHPEDSQPLRRGLNILIPSQRPVSKAWSLVRPLNQEYSKDAWLRIEGEIDQEKVSLAWDGTYGGAEFPDLAYLYEVHVRYADGEKLERKVLVLKSKEHPRLAKVGDVSLEEQRSVFKGGEYEPERSAVTLRRSAGVYITLTARVYAPHLDGIFKISGIQVSQRYVEDVDGNAGLGMNEWNCACQAELPDDSPARLKPKKITCVWDLSANPPGLYDLKLSLWHKINLAREFDLCDTPLLDSDRIRVMVLD